MKSLYQLLLLHLKTFFREPAIIFWALLFPIVMAWVLGGMLHGLEQAIEPPAVLTGNAYEQDGEPLPVTWPEAIERFARSEFARRCLGATLVPLAVAAGVNLYATVKRAEMAEFNSWITPLEIARYLGPL